jgi:hypothetical protein
MKIDGHCHCGRITFAAEVDPAAAFALKRQIWRRSALDWVDGLAAVPASEKG